MRLQLPGQWEQPGVGGEMLISHSDQNIPLRFPIITTLRRLFSAVASTQSEPLPKRSPVPPLPALRPATLPPADSRRQS